MRSTMCQQCGRAIVPDAHGAGMCASCGWVLAPTTAATTPSADAPTGDASTRALPPVVPAPSSGFASMETQPARPVAEDDSATRPSPPPLPVLPRTAELPAMAALPPSPTGAGSRLRTWGMIAVVVVLLAIIAVAALVANGTLALGGAAGTPTAQSTPTPTPTPTTPAGFKPYVAPGAFQMNVPADWAPFQAGQNGSATAFLDVSGKNQFFVQIFSGPSLPSPQSADAQALTQLSAGKPMQNRQPADSVTLAGQSWTREMADLPVHGTQSHVVALAALHGTQLYLIYYFAPITSFEVTSVTDFQPMLNSFTFAS